MSMDRTKPISTYHGCDSPGAKPRTVGILILMVTAILYFFLTRDHALDSWTKTDFTVETHTPNYHSRRYRSYYDLNLTGPYLTEHGVYQFSTNYNERTFGSYSQADAYGKTLHGRKIPIRYAPQNPNEAMLESLVAQNHMLAPMVSWLVLPASIGGAALLLIGLVLQGTAAATETYLM